jgi:predicted MPP superfamily phosphohydrolase
MTDNRLPRILSPNLGCPQIVSVDALNSSGADIVLAGCLGESDWTGFHVQAVPSHRREGLRFTLGLSDKVELDNDELPQAFKDVSETRFLISTTLRSSIFKGNAQFWRFRIRPQDKLDDTYLRSAQGSARPTLYDLVLYKGEQAIHKVSHALCVRPPTPEVRFIHLTDAHVAERNDLIAQEANSTLVPKLGEAPLTFLNFNDRLREFIHHANALADAGELDFVLALGDLVDFVNHGFGKSEPGDNNWQVLEEILTGSGDENSRGNQGLRVPVFTTTGNHDWRTYPYPPEFCSTIFDMGKKDLENFDYLYSDTDEAAGAKISQVQSKLVSEGSPLLVRSWWGLVVGSLLRWTQIGWDRFWTRALALAGKDLRQLLFWVVSGSLAAAGSVIGVGWPQWARSIFQHFFPGGLTLHTLRVVVGLLILLLLVVELLRFLIEDWVRDTLREKITGLIGIESDVGGLDDYFLKFNPYFNYSFRVEKCYFLILDTSHDALTAQSFWDDGGKKLRRLKVRDNILGGSPESMAFYPPNEYYPYSQIAWLEAVLGSIQRTHQQPPETDRYCRIIVGLHAPPANLSPHDRKKADNQRRSQGGPLLLQRGWPGGFDVHYGTVNHYVSEFLYLCLGFRESALEAPTGPGVDIVLSGHVHWNIDFQLRRPVGPTPARGWRPLVYYGDFSAQVEQHQGTPNCWWDPLILQTAACGPPSETDGQNPYFRYITVDQNLGIRTLQPRHL